MYALITVSVSGYFSRTILGYAGTNSPVNYFTFQEYDPFQKRANCDKQMGFKESDGRVLFRAQDFPPLPPPSSLQVLLQPSGRYAWT